MESSGSNIKEECGSEELEVTETKIVNAVQNGEIKSNTLENNQEELKQTCDESKHRKGKPITGFAREIILKVADVCDAESKTKCCKYSLNAATKRAALYTGVSERTIQRIRNENREKKVAAEENLQNKLKGHPDEGSNYDTMMRVSKKGQTIPNSAREIISKVINACDKEYWEGGFLAAFESKSKRTALYTGVSQRTVQRIRQENEQRNKTNQEKILRTPGKKRKRLTYSDKIDDFDFHSIRQIIDEMILVQKINPTCSMLFRSIMEQLTDFHYSEDTLYRLLNSKGYEWYKGAKGKKILVEKLEIINKRLRYLERIKKFETEGKFIVYLDDKLVGLNLDESCESTNEILSAKGGICASGRFIIMHEFSSTGFLRRAQKVFRPNMEFVDPQPDVTTLENWLKNQVFDNIPPNSVIIMSTKTYDYADVIPNEYAVKSKLVEYLHAKNLKFKPWQSNSELYQIILDYVRNLPSESKSVDKIIEKYGHTPLRLPTFMSEFSPIELAWTEIKRYVSAKVPNGKVAPKSVQKAVTEVISFMTNETLQGYVQHVIEMENYFWDKGRLMKEHYNNVVSSCNASDISNNNRNSTSDTKIIPLESVHTSNVSVIYPIVSSSLNTIPNNNPTNLIIVSSNSNISTFIPNHITSTINTVAAANMDLQSASMTALLPNHLGYARNVLVPVLDKTMVVCQSQDVNIVQQSGSSYLNL